MARMKKHLPLEIDYRSTVKLTANEAKNLQLWLSLASEVMGQMLKHGVLAKLKVKDLRFQVSLLIAGDSAIRKLNREHRGKDKTTDVLSFPAIENLRDTISSESELFLGDLAISWPQTKRQAKEFSIPPMDEFIHLFFHGMLHLMGYDHEVSRKEEILMQKWEDKFLEEFSKLRKKKGA